jgi:hypothetical protein
MPHEFARNIRDDSWRITRALPTADGNVTSSDFDLGADVYKTESFEFEIAVPALSAVNLPSADTLTFTVQAGSSAAPSTTLGLSRVITGTGSAIAAQVIRFRLPSDVARYVNVRIVAAGGTGDMSSLTATIRLLF